MCKVVFIKAASQTLCLKRIMEEKILTLAQVRIHSGLLVNLRETSRGLDFESPLSAGLSSLYLSAKNRRLQNVTMSCENCKRHILVHFKSDITLRIKVVKVPTKRSPYLQSLSHEQRHMVI